MELLLKNKIALVYGAGYISSAVARAFAREGAHVYVAARSQQHSSKLVADIKKDGGIASFTEVDVLDKGSVEAFVDGVVAKAGRIDISFCATAVPGGEQGAALSEITCDDFMIPIIHYTKAQFLTTNAAGRHMVKQGSGVLMMITATPSKIPIPFTTGFGPAWAAIEALFRTLSAELGPQGVRTIGLFSAGSPESQESITKTFRQNAEVDKRVQEWKFVHRNLLGKWPTLEQVGNMAAFMASDKAGVTTGTSADITGGMINF